MDTLSHSRFPEHHPPQASFWFWKPRGQRKQACLPPLLLRGAPETQGRMGRGLSPQRGSVKVPGGHCSKTPHGSGNVILKLSKSCPAVPVSKVLSGRPLGWFCERKGTSGGPRFTLKAKVAGPKGTISAHRKAGRSQAKPPSSLGVPWADELKQKAGRIAMTVGPERIASVRIYMCPGLGWGGVHIQRAAQPQKAVFHSGDLCEHPWEPPGRQV